MCCSLIAISGGTSVSEDDIDEDALAADGEESEWASESEAEGIGGQMLPQQSRYLVLLVYTLTATLEACCFCLHTLRMYRNWVIAHLSPKKLFGRYPSGMFVSGSGRLA